MFDMKHLNDRHAFTMMELIFILIVIGILAAVIIPKSRDTRLREAADQIVSHIRYTQHLAMMNDKFDPNNDEWYKERWQMMFWQDGDSWIYTIFSDADIDGNIDETEIAINPQDSSRRLSGIASAGVSAGVITKDLNIGKTYDVLDITFTDCKNDDDRRIFFDYLGRPMSGVPFNQLSPYNDNYLISSAAPICTITITENSGGSLSITIQPETGFAKIE
jgi:type II secretory pathway pseudopilin PulG